MYLAEIRLRTWQPMAVLSRGTLLSNLSFSLTNQNKTLDMNEWAHNAPTEKLPTSLLNIYLEIHLQSGVRFISKQDFTYEDFALVFWCISTISILSTAALPASWLCACLLTLVEFFFLNNCQNIFWQNIMMELTSDLLDIKCLHFINWSSLTFV